MKFIVYRSATSKWYWRLVAKNGLTIADGSECYASAGNCRKAVNRVIKGVPSAEIHTEK